MNANLFWKQHKKIKYWTITTLLIVAVFVILHMGNNSVFAAVNYNRAASVTWASNNNRRDNNYYGERENRRCPTYIGSALSVGGLNTATDWIDNYQIVQWMLNNPNAWEDKALDQLVEGDFVLYSSDPNAPSNWTYLDPTDGLSLWKHVALIVSPGRVAAWNAEYYNIDLYTYTGLPYHKGVHIRDTNFQDQGILSPGYDQRQIRNPGGLENRWKVYFDAGWSPTLFDVKPVSGNLTYRLILKNANGQILVDTRSSNDGRGIITLENYPTGDYYLHIIPDTGVSGEYEVAAYAYSIPMIKYEWGSQTSYSNIRRWQAPVGSTPQNFYVIWTRTDGNLEITWELRDRESGSVLSSGTSSNGKAIAQGTDSGWADFWITSVTGDGSYQIGLSAGVTDTTMPTGNIIEPSNNSNIGPGTVHIIANALDIGGSGIKRVRIYVKYDSDWHLVGDDYSAPYEFDWNAGCIAPQQVQFGIHVEDNAGNYIVDPTPLTNAFLQGEACIPVADGIKMKYQSDQVAIAIADLLNPDIKVTLANDYQGNGEFNAQDIDVLVQKNTPIGKDNQIAHYYVAINGTGFSPDWPWNKRKSAGSILGIKGQVYGYSCVGGQECIDKPGASFFFFENNQSADIRRSKVDFNDENNREYIYNFIQQASNGFVVGYSVTFLDIKNYAKGPCSDPNFPEYVACPEIEVGLEAKTAIGISLDGTKLFLAKVSSSVSLKDLALKLKNLGAARAILLDSNWSSQFDTYSGMRETWYEKTVWLSRKAINSIAVYNEKSTTNQDARIMATGGIVSLQNGLISFQANTFADRVNMVYSPSFSSTNITQKDLILENQNKQNPILSREYGGVNVFFNLSFAYQDGAIANPSLPFAIAMTYEQSNVPPNIKESDLKLYYWDGNTWVCESSSTVDIQNNVVFATTTRSGEWAILAQKEYKSYVPVLTR